MMSSRSVGWWPRPLCWEHESETETFRSEKWCDVTQRERERRACMKEENNSCHKIDKLREHTHHALRQGAKHMSTVHCVTDTYIEERCPSVQ